MLPTAPLFLSLFKHSPLLFHPDASDDEVTFFNQSCQNILRTLPTEYSELAHVVFAFLSCCVDQEPRTKMSLRNISICFGLLSLSFPLPFFAPRFTTRHTHTAPILMREMYIPERPLSDNTPPLVSDIAAYQHAIDLTSWLIANQLDIFSY